MARAGREEADVPGDSGALQALNSNANARTSGPAFALTTSIQRGRPRGSRAAASGHARYPGLRVSGSPHDHLVTASRNIERGLGVPSAAPRDWLDQRCGWDRSRCVLGERGRRPSTACAIA